ncbi:Hsp20/alpha crystallin family protein [Arthrobacter sp. ES3-54]|jgi:HSP20 family protein|uniref:Hsp20/alpha crystallin family protein n=1 Tax=Arthrobacter sp. ES3-54 TaxID=1502991 RepID=UPI002406E334|nr:Hsp20/alpha crystallin family protein [Arthrobacter sp. ES3-54]MDF9750457.1 HSP20 family protein [Arthrobacter sp. ES3-54]
MDNLFRRTGIDVPEPVRRFLQGETDTWLRVEEYRDGNTMVVRTDVPGIDPDQDIDITVTDGALHIVARRREPADKDQPGYRSEVHYGEHSRSIPLPRGANLDTIEASYIDGVLEVRTQLPEQTGTSATKVHVSRGGNRPPEAPKNNVM